MRRSKYKESNAKENYIKTRIAQLMDDMNKAHSEHDNNCYMEKAGW